MAIVRYTAGKELTPERRAAMKAEIEAAAKRPYTYDPDCPLLTEKQLAEFRPVNYTTMEERAQAIREMKAADPAFAAEWERMQRETMEELAAAEKEERAQAMKRLEAPAVING